MTARVVCPQCRRYRWIPLGLAPYCTPSCKREAQDGIPRRPLEPALVPCCCCPAVFAPQDPRINYRSHDGRWWCADRQACRIRAEQHKYEIAAMCRALESVWDRLELEGWRI